MATPELQLAGIELYFDDTEATKRFYQDVLGLTLTREQPRQFAQFDGGSAFVCLERKGSENYPSRDKAVLFLETADLQATIARIGPERILRSEPAAQDRPAWAVLHDPEAHNIVLLEKGPA